MKPTALLVPTGSYSSALPVTSQKWQACQLTCTVQFARCLGGGRVWLGPERSREGLTPFMCLHPSLFPTHLSLSLTAYTLVHSCMPPPGPRSFTPAPIPVHLHLSAPPSSAPVWPHLCSFVVVHTWLWLSVVVCAHGQSHPVTCCYHNQ